MKEERTDYEFLINESVPNECKVYAIWGKYLGRVRINRDGTWSSFYQTAPFSKDVTDKALEYLGHVDESMYE